MKLSANLGFLWTELDLLDAIVAADQNGFDAVEFHWPYVTHALDVALTCADRGMGVTCLNTVGGDLAGGEFGLAAVPGRESAARTAIDKALAYASDVSASYIHVLAGRTSGPEAFDTYVANLAYAAERGRGFGVGILVEPLNLVDFPHYFVTEPETAARAIEAVGSDNLGLMFDCYHIAVGHGDIVAAIERFAPIIHHVQIASIPDRSEPDHGDVAYETVIDALLTNGYRGALSAEYRPRSTTEAGLGWMGPLRAAAAAAGLTHGA